MVIYGDLMDVNGNLWWFNGDLIDINGNLSWFNGINGDFMVI